MVAVVCGVGGSESVRDRRVEVWCFVRQGEKGTSWVAALPTTPFIYPNPGIYWATAVKKQRQRDLMRPCVGIQSNRPMCRAWRGEAGANKAKQQHVDSLGSASISRDHGTMVTDHPLRSTVRLDHPVSAYSKLQKGTFNPPASKPCPERSHGPASVALPFQHQIRTRCMSHPDICQILVCQVVIYAMAMPMVCSDVQRFMLDFISSSGKRFLNPNGTCFNFSLVSSWFFTDKLLLLQDL